MSSLEYELQLTRLSMSEDDWVTEEQQQAKDQERDQYRAERKSGRTFTEEELAQYGHNN